VAVLALVLGALVVTPLAFVVYTAFQSAPPGAPAAEFTVGHWAELLDPLGREAILNTYGIAVSVALLSVALGVLLAWLVARTDLPGRGWVGALLPVPLLVSPLFTGMAWVVLAGPQAGWINAAFKRLAGADRPLFEVYSVAGIVLVLALHYVPFAYLLVVSALGAVDPSLENASRVMGAGLLTTLRRVVIPVVTPAIGSALLLVFVLASEHFPVTTLLGVPGKIPTLQYQIYSAMVQSPARPNYAAAASLVLLLVALGALTLHNRLTRQQTRFVTVTGKPTPPRLTRLGRWRGPAAGLCALYMLLAVGLPMVALVAGSLMRFMTPNLSPALFTLGNYADALQRPDAPLSLRNTLVYGVVSATLIVLFAAYVTHVLVRRRGRLATLVGALAMLPGSVPALTLALGILWAYVRVAPAIYGTVWILLLAYLTRLTPYGVRVLSGSLVQIDADLEHAARLSGSNALQVLRRVTFPLARPALLAAWTLLFTQVILEVSMTVLLYTAPTKTTAIDIWFTNFGGQTVLAYSMSVMLAAIGFVMLLVSNRIGVRSAPAVRPPA
jgi:iron(III) transport system permease protein